MSARLRAAGSACPRRNGDELALAAGDREGSAVSFAVAAARAVLAVGGVLGAVGPVGRRRGVLLGRGQVAQHDGHAGARAGLVPPPRRRHQQPNQKEKSFQEIRGEIKHQMVEM